MVDSATGWTDLGLLGNGVVPQTAELAWKTLWKEMIMEIEQITWDEMQEAWYRFWGKNKLAISEDGEVYRTDVHESNAVSQNT